MFQQLCITKSTTTSSVEIAESSIDSVKTLITLTKTSLPSVMENALTTKYEKHTVLNVPIGETVSNCLSSFAISDNQRLDISNSAFNSKLTAANPDKVNNSNHSECCDQCIKANCTFYVYFHILRECMLFTKKKQFDGNIKYIDIQSDLGFVNFSGMANNFTKSNIHKIDFTKKILF